MGNKKYKKYEVFIINHAVGISSAELAEVVNKEYGTEFTAEEMRNFKKSRKIKSGYYNRFSDTFPKEIAGFIEKNYMDVGHKQMAAMLLNEFGREYKAEQIKAFYRNHKLNCGHTGRFEKGYSPYNKGKKMEYVHPNTKATQFKPGNKPHNVLPVGTEVIRDDGLHQTKIAEPNKWELTARLVWKKNYGEIPKGMLVEFKDSNPDNLEPENLFLANRAEHAHLNRNQSELRSHIPELTETGLVIAKIRIAAKKRKGAKK